MNCICKCHVSSNTCCSVCKPRATINNENDVQVFNIHNLVKVNVDNIWESINNGIIPRIEAIEKQIEVRLHKKPHKCPVCDGSTVVHQNDRDEYKGLIKCPSCKGEGIIWG